MPKAYFNDLGLRNVLLNQFMQIENCQDKGFLMENYIYIHLKEKYDPDSIRYWRTTSGNELDFIILKGLETGFAVECKFQSTNFNPHKYVIFKENYPKIPVQVRSYNSDSNESWVLAL